MPELAAAARPVASTERAAEAEVAPGGCSYAARVSAPATRPARQLVPRRLRPHSPIAQAAVVVVTLATLLGILTVTSPLGRKRRDWQRAQSYANAVAWVPTPTPTPKPRPPAPGPQTYPSSPGTQAVINEIKQVFGPYSAGALGVASCESGSTRMPGIPSRSVGVMRKGCSRSSIRARGTGPRTRPTIPMTPTRTSTPRIRFSRVMAIHGGSGSASREGGALFARGKGLAAHKPRRAFNRRAHDRQPGARPCAPTGLRPRGPPAWTL